MKIFLALKLAGKLMKLRPFRVGSLSHIFIESHPTVNIHELNNAFLNISRRHLMHFHILRSQENLEELYFLTILFSNGSCKTRTMEDDLEV